MLTEELGSSMMSTLVPLAALSQSLVAFVYYQSVDEGARVEDKFGC